MTADRIPQLARELLQEAEAVACLPQRTVDLVKSIGQGLNVRHRAQVVEAAGLLMFAHQALGLKASDRARATPATFEPTRVSLAGLQYFTTPGATPAQELREHVRHELALDRVPGPELAKVRVPVLVNPLTLEQLSLSPADHELLVKATRCFGLAAARGDARVERMLNDMRRNGPPYVDPALPRGVAFFLPLRDI